jgi:hypothetical protein
VQKKERRTSPHLRLTSWFRRYPALGVAYREARRRFEGLDNVCGFGIGRKFHERRGVYGPLLQKTGGFCVKVFVYKKRSLKRLRPPERIPTAFVVRLPGKQERTRVLLDVVTVGSPKEAGRLVWAHQENGDERWPTAGFVAPGRVFAYGVDIEAGSEDGEFGGERVQFGTIGAVVRLNDQSCYATSAAHVFVSPFRNEVGAPIGDRCIGVKDRNWVKIPVGSFFPMTIRDERSGSICDVMSFNAGSLPVESDWPPNFQGLARQDAIDKALKSEETCGFAWVERDGATMAVDVDLQAGLDFYAPLVDYQGVQQNLNYGFVWQLRFMGRDKQNRLVQTIFGDSGAPVFLGDARGGGCTLLGFHFLHTEEIGAAYAVSAEMFLRDNFGKPDGPNVDFRFI